VLIKLAFDHILICQDDNGKEKIKEVSLMSTGCHSKLEINLTWLGSLLGLMSKFEDI
jgi:hypothetical protein